MTAFCDSCNVTAPIASNLSAFAPRSRTKAYFDRIKLRPQGSNVSGDGDGVEDDVDPREAYDAVVAAEGSNLKWYHRAWRRLPFRSAWRLFAMGTRDTFRCCLCGRDPEFGAMSCGKKTWFAFCKVVKLAVNLGAIFLAVASCGAAIQTGITKSKMPYVNSKYGEKSAGPLRGFQRREDVSTALTTFTRFSSILSTRLEKETLNTGEVCAYDERCGHIETFPSREAAHDANYSVVHCGRCSGCSNWNDLRIQWTTRVRLFCIFRSAIFPIGFMFAHEKSRAQFDALVIAAQKNAAKMGQACIAGHLFNSDKVTECYQRDFGWTHECAVAWMRTSVCART